MCECALHNNDKNDNDCRYTLVSRFCFGCLCVDVYNDDDFDRIMFLMMMMSSIRKDFREIKKKNCNKRETRETNIFPVCLITLFKQISKEN